MAYFFSLCFFSSPSFPGHKFILAARSSEWGVGDLATASTVDLSNFSIDVSSTLVQWVYTDVLKIPESVVDVDGFTLDLMKAASCYRLSGEDR